MGTLRTKLRREIGAHKGQFAAVAVIITLGVAVYVAYSDAYLNLKKSYDQTFDRLAFAHLTVSGGDVGRFEAQARRLPGVAATATRVVGDVPLRTGGDHELVGRVVGVPGGAELTVNRLKVLRGESLSFRPDGVLVEQHMADHFGLEPGSRLEIQGQSGFRPVTVEGVVASAEYLWPARSRQDSLPVPDNFGVVFAPTLVAEALAGPAAVPEALVLYQSGVNETALRSQLTELAGQTGAGTLGLADRAANPSNATLQADIEFFGDMAVFLPVLFLVASGVATYVMLARKARSELPIIGTMLALGCSRRHVVGQYLGYGLAAGATATIPGVALGIALGRLMTFLYADIIRIPDATASLHPQTMAIGITFGIGSALLAALAPALTASRTSPAEAGRTVSPPGQGRASLLERVLPRTLRRLPTSWKTVLRGIERNWRRTVYTVIGVTMAVSLVVASWAMLDSTNAWFDALEDTNRHDARVVLAGPATDDGLARLAAMDGVANVERVIQLPVSLEAGDRRYQTVLVGHERQTRMHGFRAVDGGPDHLPERGVLAGIALRDQLDVDVGDTIRIVLDTGGAAPVVFTERLAGLVNEPIGTFAYLPVDRLAAHPGLVEPAGSALLTFDSAVDGDAMRQQLTALDDVAAVEVNQNFLQAFESYMAFFYAMIGFMIVFGAAMALALIYASISVNIAERSVELATLRAEGVRHRVLSRLITAENLIVTLLGIPPGIVLGLYLTRPLLAAYQNDLWRFDLALAPGTPFLVAGAICLTALLSQWPGLRAVNRLDIATVVRVRST